MATQFVSGNRTFAQPEIDGGEFTTQNPANNVVIIARTRTVETGWVMQATSAGVLSSAGTNVNAFPVFEPAFSRFNTLTSSGLSISSAFLAAGATYDWGTLGVGG